ncbi:phosphatase PAP2 family protein [Flavobacterium sp.]|uniref:phosphatase PAP2 family protein n=1 Tax=Flavobacterium sp. TaxID=239 RepID=UPI003BD89DDC
MNLETEKRINTYVIVNYSKLKLSLFFLPLFLLITIGVFLYTQNALSREGYVDIQKDLFYFINSKLSQFPQIIFNLTQLGDALIFMSLLTLFVLYAPKLWESLLSASIVSALLSNILKSLFLIPRPAAIFDNKTFIILGKKLVGHSSLPSGHSITVFTVLTILLFAFMPKKINNKIIWYVIIIAAGLLLVLTRVGVGAHHPLDTISGGLIGYISGLLGIFISRKYKIWHWINNKKYYPIFIVLFLICCIVLINKIINENLFVFYLSLISLFISIFKISYVYIKK